MFNQYKRSYFYVQINEDSKWNDTCKMLFIDLDSALEHFTSRIRHTRGKDYRILVRNEGSDTYEVLYKFTYEFKEKE